MSDKRQTNGPRPVSREREAKQIDDGLTEAEDEESARQTLLGQESCEVTGYEMRVREAARGDILAVRSHL